MFLERHWCYETLSNKGLVQYIKHNIRSCHPMVSQELLASKTDEDILKRLHEKGSASRSTQTSRKFLISFAHMN